MKVIGAGFGRTGTTSMKAALEHLGMPCYHMVEVFAHLDHVPRWRDAQAGRPVSWPSVFGRILTVRLRLNVPRMGPLNRMIDEIIWGGTFDGRFADKAHAIAVYERHLDDVKRHVPPERLLVFDVKEGWEPLCAFLGVPTPRTPFPHLNDTAEFQKIIGRMRAAWLGARIAAAVAVVVPLLTLAWWVFTR